MTPEIPQRLMPHVPFERIEIESFRHRPPRPVPTPERDNIQHGEELNEAITTMQRTFAETAEAQPPQFDPALIFRLRLDGYVDKEQWRRSSLTLLSEEPDGAVVLFSEDQLTEFRRRVGEYHHEISEDRQTPPYAWLASVTSDMTLWGRHDRMGRKLADILIRPDDEYRVDVELWHYGTQEECQSRIERLRDFVSRSGGGLLDYYVGSSLSIARIRISGGELERLLDLDTVQAVDLPPVPDLTVGRLLQTRLDDFPTPIPAPPAGAPGLCIIDSGISRGHPLLGAAVGYTTSIPSSVDDGLDEHGHGTMVAGIALYGDVPQCIENLSFNPRLYLFGARVTNSENRFDDDTLIVNQMREAITHFHREYGCRVFNVSLGDQKLVYDGGKPSPWAHILDTLARDLDSVIAVSAGNLPVLAVAGPDADRLRSTYPDYLLDQSSKIIEPATAANVLTVGALAHTDHSGHMVRHNRDPAIRCVAGADQPSPFTRCGPGVSGAVKPEVCEYGGNIVWDGRHSSGGRILDRDAEASVVSTNFQHVERLFTCDVGTSYAAARIAHLAGLILDSYPSASANLVRALIANAASVPSALANAIHNEDDILRVCGYGRPDVESALFSTSNRVTLVAQDEVPLNKLHLYEIPIPREYQQAGGERRITVALAFDPPVRHTRKDYLGVKMSFRLLRGSGTDTIIAWYGERAADADPDQFPPSHQCQMTPSTQRREGGTLQKAVFTARQNRTFTGYGTEAFHLLVRCQSGWASPEECESQRYALAVTIEHVTEPVEIYNLIEQQVRIPQRVRVRETSP